MIRDTRIAYTYTLLRRVRIGLEPEILLVSGLVMGQNIRIHRLSYFYPSFDNLATRFLFRNRTSITVPVVRSLFHVLAR